MRRTALIRSSVTLATAAAAAALVSASLAAAGSRSAPALPRSDPAEFIARIVGLVVEDDYERAWNSLYPAHKQVAPRHEYVACERQDPVPGDMERIEVLRVTNRQIEIPGRRERIASKAVALRVTIVNLRLNVTEVSTHTFHAVPSGLRWAWILTLDRYALYRDDACGSVRQDGAAASGVRLHPV